MEFEQKIKSLTANLTKSLEYGQKVQQELELISKQLVETQLSINKLKQHKSTLQEANNKLDYALKKEEEEASHTSYKANKVQIRLQQFQQKIALQKDLLAKKELHQSNLQQKINQLQKQLSTTENIDEEIEEEKKQIKQLQEEENKQLINIQEVYNESIALKKKTRNFQDELEWKKKEVKKKEGILEYLKINIEKQAQNKENIIMNGSEDDDRLKSLQLRKQQLKNETINKIDRIILAQKMVTQLGKQNTQVKQILMRSDETVSGIKRETHKLMKLKEIMNLHS